MATQAEQYRRHSKEDGLKLIEQVCPGKNCKVLDLGCGTGYHSSVLAERVGPGGKVIGVDPDKERVRVAREQYSSSNVVFLEGSSEDFPKDQYDTVFSNYVLHWIKDKKAVFEIVYQNLKPGGCFAFSAPLSLPPFLGQLCDLMGPDTSKRIKEFWHFVSFEAYEEMAVQCGFSLKFKGGHDTSRVMKFQNIEAVMDMWRAATHGVFDPTQIDAVTLNSFVKGFGDKTIQFQGSVVTFIFIKA